MVFFRNYNLYLNCSVSVSRSKDVPPFGPPFPDGAMFPKSPEFVEFLLTKGDKFLFFICFTHFINLSED